VTLTNHDANTPLLPSGSSCYGALGLTHPAVAARAGGTGDRVIAYVLIDDYARKLTSLGAATVLVAILGGCSGDRIGRCYTAYAERHGCHPWRPVLTNYQGERLEDQQVAILKPGSWDSWDAYSSLPLIKRITREDGTPVYDVNTDGPVHTFKLTPGTYVVDYSRLEPRAHREKPLPQRDSVQLRPGHTYLVMYVVCALSAGDARFGSQECRQLEHHVGLLIKDETTDQVIAGDSVEVHALQLRVGDCVVGPGGKDPGKTPGRLAEFIEKDGTRYAIVRWTDGRSPTEELPLKIKKC